jgi:hypothetical protein
MHEARYVAEDPIPSIVSSALTWADESQAVATVASRLHMAIQSSGGKKRLQLGFGYLRIPASIGRSTALIFFGS